MTPERLLLSGTFWSGSHSMRSGIRSQTRLLYGVWWREVSSPERAVHCAVIWTTSCAASPHKLVKRLKDAMSKFCSFVSVPFPESEQRFSWNWFESEKGALTLLNWPRAHYICSSWKLGNVNWAFLFAEPVNCIYCKEWYTNSKSLIMTWHSLVFYCKF